MKTLSIFDVQDINEALKKEKYDYVLRLKDVCGSQALTLECMGKSAAIESLCACVNTCLKDKYIQVQPGTINPYNITVI